MKFQPGHVIYAGENHGQAKLTAAQVAQIRYLHTTGRYSYRMLSIKFRVSVACIQAIKEGRSWRHIGQDFASFLTAKKNDKNCKWITVTKIVPRPICRKWQ